MLFDTLQNFAEVGIAVAGFSGIAAALDSSASENWAHGKRAGLRVLLETAGLVVLFAFVPQILDRSVLPEATSWRISGSVYAFMHIAQGRAMRLRIRRFGMPEPGPPFWGLVVGGLIIFAQVASVLLGDTPQIQLVYLAALSWHTFVAALSFAQLLFASIDDHTEEKPAARVDKCPHS